ncbi:hypothetical protein A2110_01255 [Candidatus Jorgensenbacteria bacterium GWA1_54_12]|uniref:Uncharacterized protein n=1 Tax=Candidatus Jorgensenbacteria bacterium GWA1_54_12 TaxID=1798468 RepID=A0A1F6BJ68_9BACT|nr:MAG: hypothetical protein A2110_01255 [Candidatus Jorgensenbacteria bacterium GWA1_54_12]
MVYHVTGVSLTGAQELMKKALPILKEHGAPTDINTCAFGGAIVVGPDGDFLSGASHITFGFPAFDNLRKGHLQQLADELAQALGVPCYTLCADVFAGFPHEEVPP